MNTDKVLSNRTNPLKFYFGLTLFLLVESLFEFFAKIKSDGTTSLFTWRTLQLLVSFSGFLIFLYLYLRKSLVARYVLLTIFYLMMPFFFVVLQKPVSDVPTLTMVLVLGTVFFIVIRKTYGPYKDYVNEFHSDTIERVGATTVTNMPPSENDDHFLTKTEDKSLKRAEKTLIQSEYKSFRCSCGQKIKVGIENAGKTGKCPKCKHRVTVPDR